VTQRGRRSTPRLLREANLETESICDREKCRRPRIRVARREEPSDGRGLCTDSASELGFRKALPHARAVQVRNESIDRADPFASPLVGCPHIRIAQLLVEVCVEAAAFRCHEESVPYTLRFGAPDFLAATVLNR